jgi:hypothetical protein
MVDLFACPWDYFCRGREYLAKEEPYKALKYFVMAGRIMARKGNKSLSLEAYMEAKKIYQELLKNNPSILTKVDYWNLGTIDYALDPFPNDTLIIYD